MTTSANPTMPTRTTSHRTRRPLDIVLSLYVTATFVILWSGLALGVTSGSDFMSDVWTWLASLALPVAVVVWIANLPVAVGAWAWTAELEPLAMSLVLVGLVTWTTFAAVGLARSLRGR